MTNKATMMLLAMGAALLLGSKKKGNGGPSGTADSDISEEGEYQGVPWWITRNPDLTWNAGFSWDGQPIQIQGVFASREAARAAAEYEISQRLGGG